MKFQRIGILFTGIFVLLLGTFCMVIQQPAFAQPYARKFDMMRGRQGNRKPPCPMPSGTCTDGQYLYVLQGPVIHQYELSDLTLKNTVELPRPQPQEDMSLKSQGGYAFGRGRKSRCNRPPRAQACTDGQNLYVVAGPLIFQYTLPDLTLSKTVELSKPDLPENAPEESSK